MFQQAAAQGDNAIIQNLVRTFGNEAATGAINQRDKVVLIYWFCVFVFIRNIELIGLSCVVSCGALSCFLYLEWSSPNALGCTSKKK